ncbi:shikimate dehydrogenase [Neorhizobium lilium]|uniref:Shikimate dehydrogenase (NADP(+)) n=1 Tax=Neorhizobium lilium TaxID=2503024 RepID=A0A444LAJ9_9HYPH|nr:shikimate dehydrogenase [Neorhizobium lilium]RWX74631.1 shikimate dehydrogenase [Neorhizobium lilium]
MPDSRETKRCDAFVTGWPVKHSRSPLIHNHWLKRYALSGSYTAESVAVEEFPAFISALKSGGRYRGGNVTIPHKETAFQLADRPDEIAKELGAANTLWMADGLLHATNTDSFGFAANLDERHPGWAKINRAVILGAGGASRAVIQAVRDQGVAEIHVVNRTRGRAEDLADRFGPKVHAHALGALGEVMKEAGLFVNTTSLGMNGGETLELDFSTLAERALITDIVYVPLKTPFLIQAERQGRQTVDGLGMLLHQAVPGFEKWFGIRPSVDEELRSLVIEEMDQHA